MTKTQRPKNCKKRKGGRQPVAFVVHPDTGAAVSGLRIHKSTGSYYRIDNKKSRHYYNKNGRVGLAYLRRSIYEHECWQQQEEPNNQIYMKLETTDYMPPPAPHRVITDYPDGLTEHGLIMNRDDLAAYFREQIGNPATRKEFSEMVGIPELQNIHSLPEVIEPLTLKEIIERFINDKNFKHKRQYSHHRNAWKVFCEVVAVDHLEDVNNIKLQQYKQLIESDYAVRSQKNHYDAVQTILNHTFAVYKGHREVTQSQKLEIRLNCQNWSQSKKRKAKRSAAKPMNSKTFRTMLAKAKEHSKMAYALFMSAANFAMHGSEASEIRHQDYDFEKMHIKSYREKDSFQRAAYIWNQTKTAIQDYIKSPEYNDHPEFLFTDHNGNPMTIRKVNDLNVKFRDAANLPDSVVFDGIRDMTSTGMGATNLIAQKWVMGHTTGQMDTYTVRDAQETKKALTKARKVILGK